MRRLKVLIYGDQNLNIMDGSAVWLTSFINMLTYNKTIDVTLLLKAPIKRRHVIDNIHDCADVCIINPFDKHLLRTKLDRLTVKQAKKIIKTLDREHDYDIIMLRGKAIVKQCLKERFFTKTIPYVTDFHYSNVLFNDDRLMKKVYDRSLALFVQTEEMKRMLIKRLTVLGDKFILLPPTVDDHEDEPHFHVGKRAIVYTGKFSKWWGIESLIKAFLRLQQADSTISLHIAGDKFQGDLKGRKEKLINQLNYTPGLHWIGAISRAESMAFIREADVGYAYRSQRIDHDDSVEMSTKLLEYGICGKPVVLRKTALHVRLLGDDYPLYCNSDEELFQKLQLVFSCPDVYERAARICYKVSKKFKISAVSKEVLSALYRRVENRKVTILFASHDFKFIEPYIAHCKKRYNVLLDYWTGHNKHDEKTSMALLQQADIVFCEWGLGNAVFYSRYKLRGQRLFIRLHRQELVTSYLDDVDYRRVTKIVTVGASIFESFAREKAIQRQKMVIIPNFIRMDTFNYEKENGAIYNLGLLGYVPKLKRPDRAVAIVQQLIGIDKRFKLYIKGQHPQSLGWLKERKAEREYYDAFFKRIEQSDIADHIVIERHGQDVSTWFKKIGFILSMSDLESFHLAIVEGMASGAMPVVLNWEGAKTLYPHTYVVHNEDEAVALILQYVRQYEMTKEWQDEREWVRQFDVSRVFQQLDSLIFAHSKIEGLKR